MIFLFPKVGYVSIPCKTLLFKCVFFFGNIEFFFTGDTVGLLPFRQQLLRAGVAWVCRFGMSDWKGELHLHSYFSGWEWVQILREGKCIKIDDVRMIWV